MKKIPSFLFLFLFISCSEPQIADLSLAEMAGDSNLLMGAALNYAALLYDDSELVSEYTNLFVSQYNLTVCESVMKMKTIAVSNGFYNFAPANTIVTFAEMYNAPVRGHTLVWYLSTPEWITNSISTSSEATIWLSNYIFDVMTYYKTNFPGVVQYYDVVNEIVYPNIENSSDDYGIRQDYWSIVIGEDYIEKAFVWAHTADPDAKLFINDYNVSFSCNKQRKFYELVSNWVASGVPIDGVGLQCHYSIDYLDQGLDFEDVESVIESYIDLGLELQITEFDVRINDDARGSSRTKLQTQAEIYAEMLSICLRHPEVTAFITWGFTDLVSWRGMSIDESYLNQTEDWPLPFDREFAPKKAYFSMLEVLTN